MKVVVFHANGPKANEFAAGIYQDLFSGLKKNINSFGYPLIHLTLEGHKGWGDENYYFQGNSDEVIYNRERCVLEFLKQQPNDDTVYWFTEPDSRLVNEIPKLEGDLALLLRKDIIPVTPAWRLCTIKALPFFEEAFSYFDLDQKQWNGDAYGYLEIYKRMGEPTTNLEYNNVKIEFRNYRQYCTTKGPFTTQFKAKKKYRIITKEYFELNQDKILETVGISLEDFRRKYGFQ